MITRGSLRLAPVRGLAGECVAQIPKEWFLTACHVTHNREFANVINSASKEVTHATINFQNLS
jgi:hypothetical protein